MKKKIEEEVNLFTGTENRSLSERIVKSPIFFKKRSKGFLGATETKSVRKALWVARQGR